MRLYHRETLNFKVVSANCHQLALLGSTYKRYMINYRTLSILQPTPN